MRKSINHILVAGAMAVASVAAATAQNNTTGYFLEDNTYRFQMNPAMGNSKNFVAFPVLGNLNLGLNGTLNATDLFYNVDGRTTTFLNPKVSAAEVMGNIKDVNKMIFNVSTPVVAFGFNGFGGYNTLALNVKASTSLKLPGSIFSLLKEGIANKTYDIGALSANACSYAEVSLGHSRDITSEIRIGANIKMLVGAGNIDIDMKHADLELGVDQWRVVTEGEMNANIKGAKYKTDLNKTTGHEYVSDIDFDDSDTGIAGMGVAIDLGAVYSPSFLPDVKFSAAILDLGFIKWSNNVVASTEGQKIFNTDKYTFNVDEDAVNSFDNEMDKVKDEFSALYELTDLGDQGSRTTNLGATFNIGAEYNLPLYRAMTFGLLNTTRMNGDYSWTDFRLSANWAPCSVFDAAVSANVGTFGTNIGWLLNLHLTGFNLMMGMDRMPSKFSKDMIPLSSTAAFNMGINFLF